MVIIGDISHSITHTQNDQLGRWCQITIEGANQQSLTIFNVYNTINTSISQAGPSTIYSQQWNLLRLAGTLKPEPRKQFIKDLTYQVGIAYQNKSKICILGDFNEILGKDPSLISSLCIKFKLYDPFNDLYPEQSTLPTYVRGQTHLDYIMISTSLGKPTKIGYNPFYFIYNSDHRAMFIDKPPKKTLTYKTQW